MITAVFAATFTRYFSAKRGSVFSIVIRWKLSRVWKAKDVKAHPSDSRHRLGPATPDCSGEPLTARAV
jgi:hypothetical protein